MISSFYHYYNFYFQHTTISIPSCSGFGPMPLCPLHSWNFLFGRRWETHEIDWHSGRVQDDRWMIDKIFLHASGHPDFAHDFTSIVQAQIFLERGIPVDPNAELQERCKRVVPSKPRQRTEEELAREEAVLGIWRGSFQPVLFPANWFMFSTGLKPPRTTLTPKSCVLAIGSHTLFDCKEY